MGLVEMAPRHHVVAAVLVRDGAVLLCHRHPDRIGYPNVWDLPGGHIEPSETPIDALVREVGEELGIDIDGERAVSVLRRSPQQELDIEIWAIAEWSGTVVNASCVSREVTREPRSCGRPGHLELVIQPLVIEPTDDLMSDHSLGKPRRQFDARHHYRYGIDVLISPEAIQRAWARVATTTTMNRNKQSPEDVPNDLPIPHSSWTGLTDPTHER